MTLANLGLDSLMGVEVKQTLERDHDVVLPMKDIRQLTINKLRDIANGGANPEEMVPQEKQVKPERYDFKCMMPIDVIKKLTPTVPDNAGRPMFVVHPIEGSTLCLELLMTYVKRPVYGLQCTSETPLTSVQDLARYYMNQVRAVQPQGPYCISGYSFGACVAFEMALQLQAVQSDSVEKLYLLDGSHSYVAAHTALYKAKLSPGDSTQAHIEAMIAFMYQFSDIDYIKVTH